MKKSYIVIALVITALVSIKLVFFSTTKSKASGQGKAGKKPAVPVSVFVVGDTKMEDKIYANGTILANEQAELRLESSGRIVHLNLPEGKLVTKGTLLVKLNDAEIRAQLEKVRAQLKLANETESRQRNLLQKEGISKQEYETALSSQLALKADSHYLQTQIAKTELYAPFTGVIGVRNVSVGSYITPAVILAVIHQIDPIKVEFSLPEKYSNLFNEGDQISYKKEGITKPLAGKITMKDPAIDLSNRSIRYRAISGNAQQLLFPGAFVRVELLLKKNSDALFVPTEAIVPVAKGKRVFVVKNGLAEGKLIESGIRTEDYVQVLSGLAIGDSVVVNGNFQLKDGAPVKVTKKKAN
jgi:membrane fusion protein (multidrug efflux system)